MRKLLSNLPIIITVIFIMWAVISLLEVLSKNTSFNPVYWEYNLFTLLAYARGI